MEIPDKHRWNSGSLPFTIPSGWQFISIQTSITILWTLLWGTSTLDPLCAFQAGSKWLRRTVKVGHGQWWEGSNKLHVDSITSMVAWSCHKDFRCFFIFFLLYYIPFYLFSLFYLFYFISFFHFIFFHFQKQFILEVKWNPIKTVCLKCNLIQSKIKWKQMKIKANENFNKVA